MVKEIKLEIALGLRGGVTWQRLAGRGTKKHSGALEYSKSYKEWVTGAHAFTKNI